MALFFEQQSIAKSIPDLDTKMSMINFNAVCKDWSNILIIR